MTADDALNRAFRGVFGTSDSHRSPEQLIVLARLRELAAPNAITFKAGQDERALPYAEGARLLWHEINNRISDRPETLSELLVDIVD
jgi:hypothetical protein